MGNTSLYQRRSVVDLGTGTMTAFDEIKDSIGDNKSFVLQGGAGSGKTETLKQTLEFISNDYPDKKIVCITHTNLAVDEIKSRVDEKYTVSTIHSFLNGFIKDYKKNIHQVIHKLFQLDLMERQELEYYDNDEKTQKKKEHEKYKKTYKKYGNYSACFMLILLFASENRATCR